MFYSSNKRVVTRELTGIIQITVDRDSKYNTDEWVNKIIETKLAQVFRNAINDDYYLDLNQRSTKDEQAYNHHPETKGK